MTIFVLGAGGQMGSAVVQSAKMNGLVVSALSHSECDVSNESSLRRGLASIRAGDVIVNAAAILGTRDAEHEPMRQFEINVRGAMLAAQAARRNHATIVHFSTDYVFDGSKKSGYVESDEPNPINMYGALKLASELLVRAANSVHYVLRLSSVFGPGHSMTKGHNFVDAMLLAGQSAKTIEIPDDIVMSPTYALDAAALVLELIRMQAPYGIYHGSNGGACSWREFAQAIFDLSGTDCRALPRRGEPDLLRRPLYSAMKSEKLATLGVATRPWREGLAAYLVQRNAGSQSTRA